VTRREAARAPYGAVLAGVALLVSSCGYGLAGRNVSLPAHIRVIAVPPLTNRTAYPDLERVLTEALQKELSSRGKWKVVQDATGADVDAVVTGIVVSLTQTNKLFNEARQATRVEIAVVSSVEFKDLRDNNKMLWSSPSLVASDEYPITSGTAATDASSFLRQNQDAYQRLATKFARTVVAAMLEGM
jgi:hypothetical protein